MILMKVGFDATILINGYKFSSGSSMASIPYVQDKKQKDIQTDVLLFFGFRRPKAVFKSGPKKGQAGGTFFGRSGEDGRPGPAKAAACGPALISRKNRVA